MRLYYHPESDSYTIMDPLADTVEGLGFDEGLLEDVTDYMIHRETAYQNQPELDFDKLDDVGK